MDEYQTLIVIDIGAKTVFLCRLDDGLQLFVVGGEVDALCQLSILAEKVGWCSCDAGLEADAFLLFHIASANGYACKGREKRNAEMLKINKKEPAGKPPDAGGEAGVGGARRRTCGNGDRARS